MRISLALHLLVNATADLAMIAFCIVSMSNRKQQSLSLFRLIYRKLCGKKS